MAFLLPRHRAIASVFKQATKTSALASAPASTIRAFHSSPIKAKTFFTSQIKLSTSPASLSKSKPRFQDAFRRSYMQQSPPAANNSGSLTQRLIYGGAIVSGAILATNLIFNRETREDGGMPLFEREYLNQTFIHTGLGIGIIGVAARALHTSGFSYRLMAMNPWVVIGVSLVVSIGSMYACRATSPDNYIQKYAFWTLFNVAQAATLSPLMFMSPALLARAGLYTIGMMGSIAFVGATAKQEKYLYLGGPLLAGVAIVAISGFAPLVLPATATRTLMFTENLWLWGGLAVFGGFTLYDVQKVLYHARMAERGLIQKDVVNESIALELDFLNIFIRMVQILGMQQRKR